MGIKKYKPTSRRRFMTTQSFDEVTRSEPERSLVEPVTRKGGRNNNGRITTRHQGGGHKRRYRVIDFKRDKDGVPAKVAHIEYDPNRSARIALLHYADGEKRYIVAPQGLKVGDTVESGPKADIKPGNALPLKAIPMGTMIHNIELDPGRGARSCAAPARALSSRPKKGLRRRAHAVRRAPPHQPGCRATVGEVGNSEHSKIEGREGGQAALAGRSAKRSPRSDEPGRSSAGRRRGQDHRRAPSGHAVGRAHSRLSHAVRTTSAPTRSSSVAASAASIREAGGSLLSRSAKKGPFVDARLMSTHHRDEPGRPEAHGQDVVAFLDRLSRDGRSYDRRPRRSQARTHLHQRVHGRAQAR